MKFRGELQDVNSILLPLITTLSHLAKTAVLHLTPSQIRFVITPHCAPKEASYCFFECPPATLLDPFICTSKNDNHILLQLDVSQLHKALLDAEKYPCILIKLTKKEQRSLLTFELRELAPVTPSAPSSASQIVNTAAALIQDVPVLVLGFSELTHLQEPMQSMLPTLKLNLPNLRQFAMIVDKMNLISKTLSLVLNPHEGSVRIEAKDATIEVKAFFGELKIVSLSSQEEERKFSSLVASQNDKLARRERNDRADDENDENAPSQSSSQSASKRTYTLQLNGKRLSQALHCRHLSCRAAIMAYVEDRALIIYCSLQEEGMRLTYFIPVLVSS